MTKLTGYTKVAVIKNIDGYYKNEVCYYALYDEGINVGNTVFVTGANKGKILTVDKIIDVKDIEQYYTKSITAEVICKVIADTAAYDKRVENRKRAETLKKEMDKEVKKMQEQSNYDTFAERNPILAEMLVEYKNLTE